MQGRHPEKSPSCSLVTKVGSPLFTPTLGRSSSRRQSCIFRCIPEWAREGAHTPSSPHSHLHPDQLPSQLASLHLPCLGPAEPDLPRAEQPLPNLSSPSWGQCPLGLLRKAGLGRQGRPQG